MGFIASIKRLFQRVKPPCLICINGDIFVNGQPAKKRHNLIPGDVITTGNQAEAEILWKDDSVTILGSNTRFVVDDSYLIEEEED
jgi:hypothetical protein